MNFNSGISILRVKPVSAGPGLTAVSKTTSRIALALRMVVCTLATVAVTVRALSPAPQTSGTVASLPAWQAHQQLLNRSQFRNLHWEPLGPSLQGGRVGAIAVPSPGSSTIYAGPGAGNVWKSTDNGMTWTPVFEHESAFAIGDIAVAPSDPNIVWVGTGEVQPRFDGPSFPGTGVFKSINGGQSWQAMGLGDTQHIGRVVVHPRDPNIVYVAAMGHFWSRNTERGVFRSRDGGKNWQKVLYISDQTGVIDVELDPANPETMFASAWQLPSGPESGIYRSTDGGTTWKKLTQGLPPGPLGRSHIAIAPTNSRIVYTFLDNAAPQPGARGRETAGGEVYRSDDRGETWRKANTDDLYPVFTVYGWKFCDIQVSPDNENEIYILGNRAYRSSDGGRTYQRVGEVIRRVHDTEGTALHLDQHALWIDPANPSRLILGNDGGVFQSYDRGRTWLHLNNLPIGQFSTVAFDGKDPYTIFAGSQDNGGLYALSTYRPDDAHAANDGWRHVWLDQWTGGDSYTVLPDPADPRMAYFEQQNGAIQRMNLAAGNPAVPGPAVERLSPRAPAGQSAWRFAFYTPFLVSQFNPRVLYAGGSVIVKSNDRGANWRQISPDLGESAGRERDLVHYGAVTTLSESPLMQGLLYAGMEGGDLFVTRDDGKAWKNVSGGLPRKWVSRVIASQHELGTVYASLTGFRSDDATAYLYRSTDFGATWTPIAHNLPAEAINVIREDPHRAQVLYVGTDAGVYVSLDQGATWQSLCGDLPTTPVEDLAIHPRADQLVIATHGRSLFLLDVRPVQTLTPEIAAKPLHLFAPRTVSLQFAVSLEVNPKPPGRADIFFRLASAQPAQITIADAAGNTVRTLKPDGAAGINQATWDLRTESGPPVVAGTYRIEIAAGTMKESTTLVVKPIALN